MRDVSKLYMVRKLTPGTSRILRGPWRVVLTHPFGGHVYPNRSEHANEVSAHVAAIDRFLAERLGGR